MNNHYVNSIQLTLADKKMLPCNRKNLITIDSTPTKRLPAHDIGALKNKTDKWGLMDRVTILLIPINLWVN